MLSDCVTARTEDNPAIMAKDNGPGGAKSERPTHPGCYGKKTSVPTSDIGAEIFHI